MYSQNAVCADACVCVCVHALRIASTEEKLNCVNTLIIIINKTSEERCVWFFFSVWHSALKQLLVVEVVGDTADCDVESDQTRERCRLVAQRWWWRASGVHTHLDEFSGCFISFSSETGFSPQLWAFGHSLKRSSRFKCVQLMSVFLSRHLWLTQLFCICEWRWNSLWPVNDTQGHHL